MKAIALIQAVLLLAGAYYVQHLRDECTALRAAYFAEQGFADKALELNSTALGVIDTLNAEIAQLKRERLREQVEHYIRFVNPSAPAADIVAAVFEASDATGIDPSWLVAKLKQESYFDPQAVSATGCRGLAQMCRRASQDVGLEWENAFDVRANVMAGAEYLRRQIEREGGSIRRALVRYNGGDDPLFVQRIERHRARLLRVEI